MEINDNKQLILLFFLLCFLTKLNLVADFSLFCCIKYMDFSIHL